MIPSRRVPPRAGAPGPGGQEQALRMARSTGIAAKAA
jgi:hypothetical protein